MRTSKRRPVAGGVADGRRPRRVGARGAVGVAAAERFVVPSKRRRPDGRAHQHRPAQHRRSAGPCTVSVGVDERPHALGVAQAQVVAGRASRRSRPGASPRSPSRPPNCTRAVGRASARRPSRRTAVASKVTMPLMASRAWGKANDAQPAVGDQRRCPTASALPSVPPIVRRDLGAARRRAASGKTPCSTARLASPLARSATTSSRQIDAGR